jgi:septal ring-binding cell division protein DamX
MCVERLLAENGFTTVYQTCNDNPWYIVYVVTMACRDPARHAAKIPPHASARHVGIGHFGMAEAH